MTRDEFKELVRQAANPETGQQTLLMLADRGEEIYDLFDRMTSEAQERENTIANLRDTNMKLFLRTTGDPGESESDEGPKTYEEYVEDFRSRIFEEV